MNNTDLYETLGLDKNASQDDIKKAYRKLSKKYHPDINKEPGAENTYKKVQDAYETLGDEKKRASYDQFGTTGDQQGFGGQGGFGGGFGGQGGYSDFGDIFSQMFGGAFDPNRPRQGSDLQYRLNLTFEEAIAGLDTEIEYNRTGSNGQSEHKKVKVTVPAGIDDGQQMRMSGYGEAGSNGGPFGDLFVVFHVAASKDGFERDGADVYLEQPLDFATATLGGEILVKTVHGEAKLKIPAGTANGKRFRLRGKGAPRLQGSGYGDQYVVVYIDVPTKLTRDQQDALKKFQNAMNGEETKLDKIKKKFQ
ncbi:DnaJ C-terminal domain-containing protein [Weissella koreensis]|uniref:DnaJ domain-containing protein n=1 Tax=Weissella koreensis TaxID=165096 RepID=A0A7H1MND6_9LACO|nr:DnaJ C-terminal domain-containing protein [Weissella koreensis]AVH75770.1 molecular chaperone DnaJ [Weissella koreensis]QGN20991.1 DnaJ domain-containing protein [Weissella koreensis]QNT64972.1 DnaJ domain-containing protein [Weissella koreensis]